ncbi:MAG: response regulator transcription factor [Proteobacteria bacterium]|nr:response regulator transcription factor [Pseudomonadota bacterium]
MNVMIVDDEPAARRALREYCANAPDLTLVGEYGDPRAAMEVIRRQPPDLLFLDIQMEGLTGLALARELDPQALPLIVFVTAYDQYALEAFEVSAIDYLLKPFDEERFRKTLQRVRRRTAAANGLQRQQELAALLERLAQTRGSTDARPRLMAESGGRMHMLEVAQVELLEADRNYVKLAVGRDTYHVRSTLAQAERAVQSEPMLRISRSCLINMNHLREVSRTPRGDFILVLAGGRTVTSSEGFREAVRGYLARLRVGSPSGEV